MDMTVGSVETRRPVFDEAVLLDNLERGRKDVTP